jgi:hypothetical protein
VPGIQWPAKPRQCIAAFAPVPARSWSGNGFGVFQKYAGIAGANLISRGLKPGRFAPFFPRPEGRGFHSGLLKHALFFGETGNTLQIPGAGS